MSIITKAEYDTDDDIAMLTSVELTSAESDTTDTDTAHTDDGSIYGFDELNELFTSEDIEFMQVMVLAESYVEIRYVDDTFYIRYPASWAGAAGFDISEVEGGWVWLTFDFENCENFEIADEEFKDDCKTFKDILKELESPTVDSQSWTALCNFVEDKENASKSKEKSDGNLNCDPVAAFVDAFDNIKIVGNEEKQGVPTREMSGSTTINISDNGLSMWM